ncbi:diguanylate cyclase [Halobacillus shinanisalinarum]|uniref:Diguanylate cyclase n=1 Tax=Halobacillus shinanisalinarum TaxID=2932258 RepID=A0ABY4GWH0_9BACI|nr:diguanylate cyclase [Halobacillus shinanisalinarum]UOQ92515.1 diguanylate cyclase [Halobacillus shinanisalinarum]
MLNSSQKVIQLLNVLEEQQKLTPSSRQVIEEIKSIIQNSDILQKAVPSLIVDEQGLIQEMSDAFCHFTQKSRTELIGSSLLSLLVKDKSGIVRGDFPVFKGEGTWREELCFKTSCGEERWLKTTSVAMPHFVNENVVFILGQEVTDSKLPYSFDYEQDDYTRTINALINLVFKVRYNPSLKDFFFVMFEGKLAREIELTTDYVQDKSLDELFGEKQAAFYRNQYGQAFKGKSVSYKNTYKNRIFYTTLSPVEIEGEIVEVIGSAVEITMYENAESRIRHMAYHDPLTDLPNRRKLQTDLEQYIDLSKQTEPMTIMSCDLDRFKYVNDAMGHVAGDQVIKMMTERIRSCLDDDAILYRLGGDEFVIAIRNGPGTYKTNQIGEKILEQVCRPIDLMGKKVFITMSIGVSTYPNDGGTSQELMGKADIAVHYCKMRAGTVFFFIRKE